MNGTCTEPAPGQRIDPAREYADGTKTPRPTKPTSLDTEAVPSSRQVPARPHDSGSQANETADGLTSTSEALRRAAEDMPSGAKTDDVEKTPVFDRADLAPKV